MSWRRKGLSTTLPRKQEVWQVFFFRSQATLTGPRWGLAWQTLPRTGGVCWATSSRTGWALHSSNDLRSQGVPVHLSSVWTGNFSTGVHQAAETRRLAVEAARCEATRLLRLIRADTLKEAQLHSQTTIKVLQFLGWIINFEKSDLTPSQDFQFIGMQFNTRISQWHPCRKCELRSSQFINTGWPIRT